jgi:hypothetical protein
MAIGRVMLTKGAAVVATALVAGGIAFALTGGGTAGAGTPAAQAWIDDPIDGSVVPPGPVAIVAHAYDPGGTTELAVLIDGVLLQSTVPSGAGAVLVSAEWSWVPGGEGVYIIEVIGRGSGGEAGLPGRAVVEVRTVSAPSDPLPGVSTTTTSTTTTTAAPTTTTAPPTTTTAAPTTTTAAPTTTTAAPTTTTAAPPCTPPAPLILVPADNSTFFGPYPAITFDWVGWILNIPSCPPSGYFAEVATDAGFSNIIANAHFPASTLEWSPPPTTWGCNDTYYWRVWSKRSNGTLGTVSVTFEFHVLCVT